MRNIIARVRFAVILAAIALLAASFNAYAQDGSPTTTSPLPAPTGFVNDYAGVIDTATKQQLETKLKNLKETTNPSVEIAVAVVKTTGDQQIFEYSLAVARGWKIGSKLDNNPSALLFIAVDDRKYFTQVSKDLEPILPDGVVGSLQRQYLVPEFRNRNYGKGISDTIDAYISTIRNQGDIGAANAPNRQTARRTGVQGTSVSILCCCGLIILVILIFILSRSRGGRGGGGGGLSSILPWVGGALIGNALSGDSSSSGGWGGSSSGGNSDWGGGSSGGGSDWGGFGGGGDFGGGGAGGDW